MQEVELATQISAEPTINGQIRMLREAVATAPGNLDFWAQLVNTKYLSGDHDGLESILVDALSLFPAHRPFWERLLQLAPRLDTFAFALRYADNAFVWPLLLQYVETADVPENELASVYARYLEFDKDGLPLVLAALARRKMDAVAMYLLDSRRSTEFAHWEPLFGSTDPSVLARLLQLFPNHVDRFAARLPLLADRKPLLEALLASSTVGQFCTLFAATCDWFNRAIPQCADASRYLHEYQNVLKRRPVQLSALAVKTSPNNADLWLRRARLWPTRPALAASVLEEALAAIEPEHVTGRPLSDVYVRYTTLLMENGTDKERIFQVLRNAIEDPKIPAPEKPALACHLASLQEDESLELARDTLLEMLNMKIYAGNSALWLQYLQTLIYLEADNVLAAFNRCCIEEAVSMHIVSVVAAHFASEPANQTLVFDRGLRLFKMPLSLPLWGEYLVATRSSAADFGRVTERAVQEASRNRGVYERFVLMYAERVAAFSPLDVRRVLHEYLAASNSRNPSVHLRFVDTYSDPAERRAAYTAAWESTSSVEVLRSFADFERSMNETARAAELDNYIQSMGE